MKKIAVLFFSIFLFFSLALPAFAGFKSLKDSDCLQPVNDSAGVLIENAITIGCIPIIVGNVVYWLLILAGIAALILIIISGFKFVTSGGDPKQAEGARKTLTWAIIGLIVVLLSFGIITFIAEVTGVEKNCLTRFGFTQCAETCTSNSECLPNWVCRESICVPRR